MTRFVRRLRPRMLRSIGRVDGRVGGRMSRLFAGIAVCVVGLVLPGAVPVARANASVTGFSFVSAPGDFIGQGGSGSYSPANWTFAITGDAGYVRFQLRAKDSFDDWEVDLAAPIGGTAATA